MELAILFGIIVLAMLVYSRERIKKKPNDDEKDGKK